MRVVLAAVGVPLPGVAAEFRAPVVQQFVTCAIAPDVELAEWAMAILCASLNQGCSVDVWLNTMSITIRMLR